MKKPQLAFTELPRCICPHCGNEFARACHVDNTRPKPGQLTLCMRCGEVAEFGPNLELVKPTEEKLSKLSLVSLQRGYQIRSALLDSK